MTFQTKHGFSYLRVYKVWHQMMRRCYNPEDKRYARYGARGITVCSRWHDLATFIRDLGEPARGMTLDRVNNDRGYRPGNVRWATRSTQQNNRGAFNVRWKFRGRVLTMKEWACETGIKYTTLRRRVQELHWPLAKALTTPTGATRKTA